MKDHPFQVGDKVVPFDSWATAMPAVPRMRQGRVYCVNGVKHTKHGPRVSFVAVRCDARGKSQVCRDSFWPAFAFRLVHRVGHGQKKGGA